MIAYATTQFMQHRFAASYCIAASQLWDISWRHLPVAVQSCTKQDRQYVYADNLVMTVCLLAW
jgi:hypothetical protein